MMSDRSVAKKSKEIFWYARAALAGCLMLLSLALFSSAFANQTPEAASAKSTETASSDEKPAEANKADAKSNDSKAAEESKVKDPPAKKVDESSTPSTSSDAEMQAAPAFGRGARLMSSFTVFLLAVFVGVEVINKVPPTLHTPLMSGSNAISGITVIGALLTAGHVGGGFGSFLGMIAVVLAMINVVGGYVVTHRMLMMFKKR